MHCIIYLNLFEKYCDERKLTVNIARTKILIFTACRYGRNLQFFITGTELEIVTEYRYLGIFLSTSGSYLRCKQHMDEQENNAMFSLSGKIRIFNLRFQMQLDLFNKLIKPILLYGCKIWAIGNLKIIERVQLEFLKMILNLKRTNPVLHDIWRNRCFPTKGRF